MKKMQEETKHWRLEVIPRYVLKNNHEIVWRDITCPRCNGSCGWYNEDCDECHNTGKIRIMKRKHEPKPEISMEYVEHMKKAHRDFFDNQ